MCTFGHCLCFNLTRSYREFILVAITKTKHLMKPTVFKFCLKLYGKELEIGEKKKNCCNYIELAFFPSIISCTFSLCMSLLGNCMQITTKHICMALEG